MRFIITILLCISESVTMLVCSQTISGTVIDSVDNTPVADVIVQLLDKQGKGVKFALTDDKGAFSLPVVESGITLSFKCMGYRWRMVSVSEALTVPKPLLIMLESEPFALEEVVVKAPDIMVKSDTLIYNVQRFTDAQDRSIADVLKKMPGIEVANGGQIKYNGIPINKFYIEGNDLLEGRYGVATNNISPQDVQNVEIMENHQPIRALSGIEYSEQAGLNLRLKESAKVRWTGIASVGGGFSPALYDGSLFAMRIAGKLQSMETLRLNNTGWNPASQSAQYTSENLSVAGLTNTPAPDYIYVGQHSSPLDEMRTRFNRSLLFNTSNSVKIGADYDLKVNASYERDRLDFQRSLHTDYFDNSIMPYSETESLLTDRHAVSAQTALQSNKTGTYLKNRLTAKIYWNDAASDVVYNNSDVAVTYRQNASMPSTDVSNELQIVKRIRNQILTVASDNRFVSKPHSLAVDGYYQGITSRSVLSTTEASYGWIFGKWKVRGRAGLMFNHYNLESQLYGLQIANYPAANDSRFNRINLYVRPEAVFENKLLLLNPYVLINCYRYDYDERLAADNSLSKIFSTVSPALAVRYRFTAKTELFADAKYSITPQMNDLFYSGLIMNDYRTFSVGLPSTDNDSKRSASLSLRYRNPVSSVFANIGCGYERNDAALMTEQTFINDRILMTYAVAPHSSDIFRANGGVSKGVYGGKIHISLDLGYAAMETASMRNSVIVPYKLTSISAMPKIKGTLRRWISTEYSLIFSKNSLNITGTASSYNNMRQKMTISLFPSKKLQLYAGGEHYFTRFNDNTSDNLLLIDAGARLTLSPIIDISLSANNLADSRKYTYSRYETLSETVYQYHIRPRNVLVSVYLKI